MDNFIFGLQGLARGMYHTLGSVVQQQVVWGFAIGFAASTIVHMFVTAEHPRQIPHILTKPSVQAFDKVAPRNDKGSYMISYTTFDREYHRVRSLFYVVVLAFLLVVVLAMLRFQ